MALPSLRRLAAPLVALLPAFACTDGDAPVEIEELPHVLVVTIDTLRADHLGCYGYFRETSPFLDDLAAESLVFERCLAPVAQTLPSHTSLFTGLAPHEHGVLANLTGGRIYDRAPGAQTLAAALGDLGYRTVAYVAAEPLKRGTGIESGFEEWWEPEEPDARADELVDRCLEGYRKARNGPTFTWLHLFDVHRPYEAPEGYAGRFRGVAAEDQARRLRAQRVLAEVAGGQSDAPTTSHDHDEYDAEIRFVDDQLARLWAGLQEPGLAEQLLLVVTSDHGEGLWQHGHPGHGHIWREGVHVPLLLRGPWIRAGRVADPIELRDVLPTALGRVPELADALGGWLAACTGRDVLASHDAPRPIVSQFPSSRSPMTYAIEQEGWRLIHTERRPMGLYDLTSDPHELRSLHVEEEARVARMKSTLDALLEGQRLRGEALGAAPPRPVGEERIRALGELGYGGEEED